MSMMCLRLTTLDLRPCDVLFLIPNMEDYFIYVEKNSPLHIFCDFRKLGG